MPALAFKQYADRWTGLPNLVDRPLSLALNLTLTLALTLTKVDWAYLTLSIDL